MESPPAFESVHPRLRLSHLSTATTRLSPQLLMPDSCATALMIPMLSSCYMKPHFSGFAMGSSPMMRALFSSSSARTPSSSPEVQNFKLPPPVNPPDPENPDRATLRAQWDHAVRLYGRMYSHAWGTAILAGVTLFGIGWWIKGENPLKALSPTGELKKKEETAD